VFAIIGSEVSNVWQLPISPESAAASGPPTRLTFGSAEERSPSVSRSPGIAFSSIIENVDVWRLPLDPHSGVSAGSMERVTDDAAIDQMMNLTQSGTSMGFVSTRTKASEAWLRDLRTGRERQLTFEGATFARLDPDGSRVAIRRPGKDGAAEILRIADGARTPVCQGCVIDDWSVDGSRLVMERGSPAALFVVDLATGRERPLASHPDWNLFRAHFSPDGRWVAFHTTNSAAQRQVYVVPAGEPAVVPVSRWIPIVEDFGIQPSWAPDGRAIYYFSLRDGSFCPWIQSVDPATARPVGDPRVVQHLHNPRLQAASRAIVTNDVRGNFLYVTLTGMTGNIWMLAQ
jgi:Tol biopolymer transport system component